MREYIGKIISHYRILEEIGRGGMGVVYKAEDTKLKRTVALKFLPPSFSLDDDAKQRFIHEAQAASSLQHNNICTVHDIDETEDGQMFICMDCYAGETLSKKIARGPLRLDDAIEITIQIAQGLLKAHEQKIIHRDIKPANIFITNDGIVKILDFGLAKLSGQTMMTKMGSTMGTVAYMSPEQAKGEKVDYRTDIWSLGVVLYEIVTGHLPFKREYDQAVVYSILNEEPILPTSIRKDIPNHLETIVIKSLEKDPEKRYENIQEVLKELKKPLSSIAVSEKKEKSIIVLPFVNMSPDPEQEYFSDGLTEEIITDLSHIHDLLVISRSSAVTFKGTKKKIREIAREVNVQYVLEGSVRKSGNSLRITAQLINAQNDTHLWSEKYSGTLDDVFDIQEKVSRAIVQALRLRLSPEEERKMGQRPFDDVRAYECYLKAHMEVLKSTEGSVRRAIQYLQNGLDIMGENPFLYTAMAWAYWMMVNIGVEQEEYLVKAEAFARKALALYPECAQAHAMLGWIAVWSNKRKAICHFEEALTINADDTLALQGLSMVYVQLVGKVSAAVPLCERLLQIDPLDVPTKWMQGGIYFYDGQFDLALAPWQRLSDESPENPVGPFYCAFARASLGQMSEAVSIICESASDTQSDAFSRVGIMLRYAILKDKEKVLREMTPELRKTYQRDATFSHHLAGIFALLDEKEESLNWLQNAIDRGFINYPMLAQKDPLLANLRGEERFKKLMKRVKYKWENFEV